MPEAAGNVITACPEVKIGIADSGASKDAEAALAVAACRKAELLGVAAGAAAVGIGMLNSGDEAIS
jgi:hypothetical protein